MLAATHVTATSLLRISPELEPVSSQKFFGKDYPADKMAVADKHYVFGHPYPAVQDSQDFDADYVKDENSDGGRWDTQMEYDTLRAKIIEAKKKMAKLKAKMEAEYEDWMRAKKDVENYDEQLEKAREEARIARNAADAAAKRVNDLEGASQKDGTKAGGAVGDAIADVKKEMDHLQECKEALAKAKEKLKELLKQKANEKDAEEKKAKEEAAAAAEAAKEKSEEQKKQEEEEEKKSGKKKEEKGDDKKKKEGKKEEDKTEEEKEKDDVQEEEKVKKEVETDKKKTSSWRKNYLKELEDVSKTEKELEAAAKTLKKFRRLPHVDDDGGVYNVPESFATMRSPAVLTSMAFAVLLAARP